jgi:putative membrane protein
MNFDLPTWAVQTIALFITAALLPRLRITSIFGAILTTVVLGFVNSHYWSAALFFSVPDSLTYRALTLLAANGAIFWITVKILPGIEIDGFLIALVAPIVFTLCSLVINEYAPRIDWQHLFNSGQKIFGTVSNELEKSGLLKPAPTATSSPRHH